MFNGVVTGREARIHLKIKGPRREQDIEAVIDTGYTAWLFLPPRLIAAMGLRWQSFGRGILADGSECLFDVFGARSCGTGEQHASSWLKRTARRWSGWRS